MNPVAAGVGGPGVAELCFGRRGPVVLSRDCTLSVGESAPAGGVSKLQPHGRQSQTASQPQPGVGSEPAWPTQVGSRGEGMI